MHYYQNCVINGLYCLQKWGNWTCVQTQKQNTTKEDLGGNGHHNY